MKILIFLRKRYALFIVIILTTSISQSKTEIEFHDYEYEFYEWGSATSDVAVTDTVFSYSGSFYPCKIASIDPLETFSSAVVIRNSSSDEVTNCTYFNHKKQFKH